MAVIRTTQMNYAEMTPHISEYNEVLNFGFVVGAWSTATVNGLSALSSEIGRQAQMIGYANAFMLYTVACFAALPFLLFVKIRRAG